MDLSTTYLGFRLPHPLIPGASPLADSLESVRRLEDAGAPAFIVRSLFEEQITHEHFRDVQDVEAAEETWFEALTYYPRRDEYMISGVDRYLDHVHELKEAVSVPVIASLNGVTPGGWLEFATQLEAAGADALELNFYLVAADPGETGEEVERRVTDVVRMLKDSISIPIAVKLSEFFSSLPNVVGRIEEAGAAGVVIFNRFYQPDIDIEELEVMPRLRLSDSSELLLRLRWLAILSGRTNLSLASHRRRPHGGGRHQGGDVRRERGADGLFPAAPWPRSPARGPRGHGALDGGARVRVVGRDVRQHEPLPLPGSGRLRTGQLHPHHRRGRQVRLGHRPGLPGIKRPDPVGASPARWAPRR